MSEKVLLFKLPKKEFSNAKVIISHEADKIIARSKVPNNFPFIFLEKSQKEKGVDNKAGGNYLGLQYK